jgi:hypothetical protein
LDRHLTFSEKEIDQTGVAQRATRTVVVPAPEAGKTNNRSNWPLPF